VITDATTDIHWAKRVGIENAIDARMFLAVKEISKVVETASLLGKERSDMALRSIKGLIEDILSGNMEEPIGD
jgi:hypothetical protein